jgi:tubulin-folding cofactor B
VQNKRGFVRFIGATKFASGVWVGVELEEFYGKNDGALKGIRYFRCAEDKGVFVKPDKLSLVINKN